VSRSGVYARLGRGEREETELERLVIHCFDEHGGNYGRKRIRRALAKEHGVVASEKKIAAILKKHGRAAKAGKKRKHRKKKSEAEYISENLLPDRAPAKSPNEVWQSDITEYRCKNGKLYVCGVLDAAMRKMVGWSILPHMRKEIVERALNMAIGRARPEPGLIFHSDRGSVYTSKRIKKILDKNKMIGSMSRPGTPSDNQLIESFWKTMKLELGPLTDLSFNEARQAIARYIELYYNSRRLHSSIGYRTPNEAWAETMRTG